MAAVSEDPITLWLKLGALDKLEQVVLDGYGDQLYGKTSRIPQVNKFLRQVPLFQNKIDEIHKAVGTGNLREVQHLIDRKKLAFCRDHMGASPMHKAVLFGQKHIIDYLLDRYPSVVHARDHRGRTPLHYAAVLPDGGEVYHMLLEHGADVKATDVYGNKPEYYLEAQDELNLQVLKDGFATERINPAKMKGTQSDGQARDKGISARPVGGRIQVRQVIGHGSLDTLEDLVIQGHGDKLLGESSSNPLVLDFLRMVPIYMERIYEIHRAVTRGHLRDVQTLLDRKKLALSRDPLGATPLHKAVMYNHFDIARYIAYNFPLSKDAKDLDGRSALHYAAVLKDNHEMYNMLVSLGANPLILDYRGKTAEYYLQFPEHLHLDQLIKQSQRANANYIANHTNKMKAISPKRKSPYPTRAALFLENSSENQQINGTEGLPEKEIPPNGPLPHKMPKKILFRSHPFLPPPKLKRLEINSANIRRWIKEEDIEKLEGAVIEGYADKITNEKSESEGVQQYIAQQVPRLVKRIEAIHSAVSNDDIKQLQSHLDREDFALAKDHLGMAPIHRAVLLNKIESLKFLLEKFPETVNAKDKVCSVFAFHTVHGGEHALIKEGRTALHYAAAMSRGGGSTSHKLLMEAGADSRIRDNQGRSAEYYRTHHVPIPIKFSLQSKGASKKGRSKSEPPPQRSKRAAGSLSQSTLEKITQSVRHGDVEFLREFVQDGYGSHLLGRTSWHEDVRQFLKTVPSHLSTVESLFHSASHGDVETLSKIIEGDTKLLRAKNEDGLTVVHHAVLHDQLDVINYFLEKHPNVLTIRDRTGSTPLHIAGQQKNNYLYTILIAAGADPMTLDQKGRTAEYYMNVAPKAARRQIVSPSSSSNPSDIEPKKTKPDSKRKEDKKVTKGEEKEKDEKEQGTGTQANKDEKAEESKPEVEKAVSEDPEASKSEDAKKEEESEAPDQNTQDESEKAGEEDDEKSKEDAEKQEDQNEGNDEAKEEEAPLEDDEDKENEDKAGSTAEASTPISSSGDRLNELIDYWIQEKDLLRLEHVVIAGQGERLVGRSSTDRQVQEFLDLVPTYMARIRGVHDAVVRGNLGEVEAVLTRKRFALSRDHLGASPLHLAVLHGHTDIVKYIVTNFPEALDGPDNEGRTPLHYAAIVRDGGNFYRMLKMAGADETAVDKASHTAEYYLNHPGELTIRDLLESYRITDPDEKPSQVNIWQRPPTEEIEKQLTPPSSGSLDGELSKEEKERRLAEQQLVARHHDSTIYPILFDQQNRDSRYLASVLGDALVKGLTHVAQKRPADPIGYLATWLYQYASRASRGRSSQGEQNKAESEDAPASDDAAENPAPGDNQDGEEAAQNDDSKTRNLPRNPLGVVQEDPNEDIDDDDDEVSLEFEDHTKMKDEDGQTVLHFAAGRAHPDGSFYGLIGHADMLLAERDSQYRTARDIAEETGQMENVAAIDRYVLDAFIQQRSALIQTLVHEGYDHLLKISDSRGRDLLSILRQHKLSGSMALLRDIADFVKLCEELHTFVRNSYLDGVRRLVRSDHTLVTAKTSKARCALHVAVLFEHLDVIEALVKANSSAVHVPDNLGRTPLHYAMATKKVDQIARILVRAGAMRSTRDVRMRTPSYFFIYKQEIQQILEEELKLP